MSNDTIDRQRRLKASLLDRKRRVWNELKEELFNKLGREYNAQFDNPHDMEDLALIDVIEDTGLALADAKKNEVELIDVALRKLDERTYGLCDSCGIDIDEGRLKLIPFAALCVRCASAQEGSDNPVLIKRNTY